MVVVGAAAMVVVGAAAMVVVGAAAMVVVGASGAVVAGAAAPLNLTSSTTNVASAKAGSTLWLAPPEMKLAKAGALTAMDAAKMVATAARMRRVFIPHGIVFGWVLELDQINLITNKYWYSPVKKLGLRNESFLIPSHTIRCDESQN